MDNIHMDYVKRRSWGNGKSGHVINVTVELLDLVVVVWQYQLIIVGSYGGDCGLGILRMLMLMVNW